MEWEGIFYFFEHSEDAHTLVVGDSPSVHSPLTQGGTLPLRSKPGPHVADGEHLSTLQVVHRLRPGAVHLKDFDFEKPALDLSGRSRPREGVAALELYDYPAGYVASRVGRSVAEVRAEEVGVRARMLSGTAVAPRLTPGYLL